MQTMLLTEKITHFISFTRRMLKLLLSRQNLILYTLMH